MGSRHLKTIRLLYAAFNHNDPAGVGEHLHPDVTVLVRDEYGRESGQGPFEGIPEVTGLLLSVRDLVHKPYLDVRLITEDDDRFIASITIRGTLKDSDVEGSMPAVHVFFFEGDLIRQIHVHRPPWAQLGAGNEAD